MTPDKKSKRKTKAQLREENRLAKQETDKLICYRYAQCHNASRVAKEYNVNHMYVTRAWNRLSEEERNALLEVREQVDDELNHKLIKAEAIAGDEFIATVVRARDLMGQELIRRCTGKDIRMISDKDFTSLVRLVVSITIPTDADETNIPQSNILRTHRESIQQAINNFTDNNYGKK